jgi:hypothetical protein
MSDQKETRSLRARMIDAHRGAGDLCDAIRLILDRNLLDTTAGAEECEVLVRELDEGFRELWRSPDCAEYLRQIVYCAQAMVQAFNEKQRKQLALSLVRDGDDEELQDVLRLAVCEVRKRQRPKPEQP